MRERERKEKRRGKREKRFGNDMEREIKNQMSLV
jgi:hypothetical protein